MFGVFEYFGVNGDFSSSIINFVEWLVYEDFGVW